VTRRRGQAFTKQERQAILATYDTLGTISATAKAHGISLAGVHKLVHGRRDGGEDLGGVGRREINPSSAAKVRPLVDGGISAEVESNGMKASDAASKSDSGAAAQMAAPPPQDKLQAKLAANPLAFPGTQKPEKVATTLPAPALTLLEPARPTSPLNPNPPTQSESRTRANSWELVGSIALASKSVLKLFHDELESPMPDGRSLNEFASILQKLHISYGITVEKARLLHNESTGIIAKVEDLSKLPDGVTLDVAIAFVRGTIHGKLPA
jgi:hypothetical protein